MTNDPQIAALKKEIKAGVDILIALKGSNQGNNEEASSIRSNLETKGIPREALSMAIRYRNWDEDKRRGFDAAYQLVRDSIGLKIQPDLFEFPDDDNADDAE